MNVFLSARTGKHLHPGRGEFTWNSLAQIWTRFFPAKRSWWWCLCDRKIDVVCSFYDKWRCTYNINMLKKKWRSKKQILSRRPFIPWVSSMVVGATPSAAFSAGLASGGSGSANSVGALGPELISNIKIIKSFSCEEKSSMPCKLSHQVTSSHGLVNKAESWNSSA